MSTVDRHEIPIQLMQPHYYYDWKFRPRGGEDDDPCEATALPSDGLALEEALACLENFSLISAQIEDQSYSMHRLVQLATQCWLETHGERTRWRDRALKILYEKFPAEGGDDWTVSRALYPHAQIVTAYEFNGRRSMERLAITLNSVGNYESEQGQYDLALLKFSRAAEIWKELGVSNGSDLFTAIHGQAVVLRRMGKYREAERQCLITLEGREKEPGIGDSVTLETVSNLATIYRSQGKYKEAEELYKRALRETEIMDNELDLMDATNLGLIQNTDEYGAAVRLRQTVLEERKSEFGLEHLKTLAARRQTGYKFSYSDSSMVSRRVGYLKRMNGFQEAERVLKRAFEECERSCGPDNYHTRETFCDLVELLKQQQKSSEIKTLCLARYRSCLPAYGVHGFSTLEAFDAVVRSLREEGKDEEIAQYHRETLEAVQNMPARYSHQLFRTFEKLMDVPQQDGNVQLLETLHRQRYESCKEGWGLDDFYTANSRDSLVAF
jgi:tetratricopeptide (TPR) repeat protein